MSVGSLDLLALLGRGFVASDALEGEAFGDALLRALEAGLELPELASRRAGAEIRAHAEELADGAEALALPMLPNAATTPSAAHLAGGEVPAAVPDAAPSVPVATRPDRAPAPAPELRPPAPEPRPPAPELRPPAPDLPPSAPDLPPSAATRRAGDVESPRPIPEAPVAPSRGADRASEASASRAPNDAPRSPDAPGLLAANPSEARPGEPAAAHVPALAGRLPSPARAPGEHSHAQPPPAPVGGDARRVEPRAPVTLASAPAPAAWALPPAPGTRAQPVRSPRAGAALGTDALAGEPTAQRAPQPGAGSSQRATGGHSRERDASAELALGRPRAESGAVQAPPELRGAERGGVEAAAGRSPEALLPRLPDPPSVPAVAFEAVSAPLPAPASGEANAAGASPALPATPQALPLHVEWLASRGGGTARLRLHPPELGEIELRVRMRESGVEIVVKVQEEAARIALEGQRGALAEGLAARAMRMDHFQVDTANSGLSSNPDDAHERTGFDERFAGEPRAGTPWVHPRPAASGQPAPGGGAPGVTAPGRIDLRI